MAAYVAAQFTIHDHERYGRYVRAFADTLTGFDGRVLVADPVPGELEGSWPFDKFVLIEFRDEDEARRWATSPAYQKISADRLAATDGFTVLLHALRPDPGGVGAH
jgi:uncharacterized protein (DUF1330 family)